MGRMTVLGDKVRLALFGLELALLEQVLGMHLWNGLDAVGVRRLGSCETQHQRKRLHIGGIERLKVQSRRVYKLSCGEM